MADLPCHVPKIAAAWRTKWNRLELRSVHPSLPAIVSSVEELEESQINELSKNSAVKIPPAVTEALPDPTGLEIPTELANLMPRCSFAILSEPFKEWTARAAGFLVIEKEHTSIS